jgi:glycosyltransferase involved in cell wall biosynthesis
MRILTWHVHAAWSTAFVSGGHEYLIPVLPDRGPYGRGRPRTYPWPANAIEVTPDQLRGADVDVAILQRPEEEELVTAWLGRRVPLIYVEHNTPRVDVPNSRHPMADREDMTVVHVTHFNDLFWDCGATPTTVIEHGLPLPATAWTGELPRIAVVTNEPVRRGRVTGTDLLPRFASVASVDVYGIGVSQLQIPGVSTYEDPPQSRMHADLAQRRVYLHLTRWTSLGLSLIEAMLMGCPVVALGTTEAHQAVPRGAGVVSTNVADLVDGVRHYLADQRAAAAAGEVGRAYAAQRFALTRFLADWDHLLERVTAGSAHHDRPDRQPVRAAVAATTGSGVG